MKKDDRRIALTELLKARNVTRADAFAHLRAIDETVSYGSIGGDLDAVGKRAKFESPIWWRARRPDEKRREVRPRNRLTNEDVR